PVPVPSAQVKSAVLLAGLYADGVTSVVDPVSPVDQTELALAAFGARFERIDQTIRIHGCAGGGPNRSRLEARRLVVPGDISSAVFFLAAALLLPASNLLLHNVGLNPTRTAVLDVLASMGAPTSLVSVHGSSGELLGVIV